MEGWINFLEKLVPFITNYPRWVQYFFYITIVCGLISAFLALTSICLAIFVRPTASTYNKRVTIPADISAKPQQIIHGDVPMVGLSHYSYVPIKDKMQLNQGVNIDEIDSVLLTLFVKNYGKVPADNYVFSYLVIYGSEEIFKTAQDDVSLSKGILLMPDQTSFNQIIFEKDMLLKLKSMTPIILKIKLTYTDRSGNYKDEVPYTIWVNRINNPFVLKLTSLPHD